MELEKNAVETVYHYSLAIGSHQYPVTISFYNGKFNGVRYPFSGQYTREQWRALALIEQAIAEAEEVWAPKQGFKIDPDMSFMSLAEEDNAKMRDMIWEIANSGVELEDERVPYLTIQIDKDLWKQILTTAVRGK